jgi:hypothetical protein
MPPFLPRDFLPLDAFALGAELAAPALARAQRARAAAAMRSRPAADRPPRRFRVVPPELAGAELAEVLGALEPRKILVSRLCSWSICLFTATASSSCLTDRSMAQL